MLLRSVRSTVRRSTSCTGRRCSPPETDGVVQTLLAELPLAADTVKRHRGRHPELRHLVEDVAGREELVALCFFVPALNRPLKRFLYR